MPILIGANMGLLDKLRRRKQQEETKNSSSKQQKSALFTRLLEEEIKEFFPNSGHWYSTCFRKPREVSYCNLPCHLRDNAWMSVLLQSNLAKKGIIIPLRTIKNFMDTSENFEKLRHEHELRIVEWQIGWIVGGGENWLLPDGYSELSLLCSDRVENIYRGGVKKTLRAIGMDDEVIEEGLERHAALWRGRGMRSSFNHLYQPVVYLVGAPKDADKNHQKNWLADREYQYYQSHKKSVDKYGVKTPAMEMTPEEYDELRIVLAQQNAQRRKEIEEWRKRAKVKSEFSYFTNVD